jgi:hypothetical protein
MVGVHFLGRQAEGLGLGENHPKIDSLLPACNRAAEAIG